MQDRCSTARAYRPLPSALTDWSGLVKWRRSARRCLVSMLGERHVVEVKILPIRLRRCACACAYTPLFIPKSNNLSNRSNPPLQRHKLLLLIFFLFFKTFKKLYKIYVKNNIFYIEKYSRTQFVQDYIF